MRAILLTGLIMLTAGCAAGDHRPGPGLRHGSPRGRFAGMGEGGGMRGRPFISPMGEPFRREEGGAEPQDAWFDKADADHDGVLTRAEFSADAARFFAVLDRGHDGEIDPDDITYYETELAPEIRVGGFGGGMGGGGMRGGRGGRGGGGHRGGGHRGGGGGGFGGGEDGSAPTGTVRQGAARFGYFDFPEPVTVADTNFNRGVDAGEFQHAAAERFAALDTDHDGRLRRDELPRLGGPMRGRGAAAGGRPVPAGDQAH